MGIALKKVDIKGRRLGFLQAGSAARPGQGAISLCSLTVVVKSVS